MFRRHPRVTREWAMPVSPESVEFKPFLTRPQGAAKVMALIEKAVPAIHWFYLLEDAGDDDAGT